MSGNSEFFSSSCTQAGGRAIRRNEQMFRQRSPRIARGGIGSLLDRRPPMVWAAALLYACRGAECFAAAVFPLNATQPIRLELAVGTLALLVGAGLWLFARNPSMLLMQPLADPIGKIHYRPHFAARSAPSDVEYRPPGALTVRLFAAHSWMYFWATGS
ncbi:MAG: hypothetical protein ABSH36_15720, partial [Solirubrobacteraceae bacterium]